MSTFDPGTGWIDPNPPDTTDPGTGRKLLLAGIALSGVVLLALVGVVVAKHAGVFGGDTDDDGPAVVLAGANVIGTDPFMPSTVVAPIEITDTVAGDIASYTSQLPPSSTRGARLVPGAQPGLYGTVGEIPVCDVPGVANNLDAYPDRSAVWAQAIGIALEKIPYYLNTLTPVALIADTWVTASSFTDGRAEPAQTVLQAGSAVLIDQAGVPRVQCATGNPLGPPANADLQTLSVLGEDWPDFNLRNVVAVAYAATEQPIADEFTLRDLSGGDTVVVSAGGRINLGADPAGWAPDPVAMNVPPRR